jgi:uncharacterized protein (TIGR02266 family)
MAKPSKPPPVPPSERRANARVDIVIPVRLRYESVLDFVETQSMNISRSGMFIVTEAPAPLGSSIEFEFSLTDGFVLLHGLAEVVRVAQGGIVEGMGVRFVDLDPANQAVIDRIVAVNSDEGRVSTLNFDFSSPASEDHIPIISEDLLELADPPSAAGERLEIELPPSKVAPPTRLPATTPAPPKAPAPAAVAASPAPPPLQFDGLSLRLVLGPETVRHFTGNPLVNVRSGGLMVPAEKEVPLGTVFKVTIVDLAGTPIVAASGKVVTRQDLRIGIRLTDVSKETLTRLQGEVAKLAPAPSPLK